MMQIVEQTKEEKMAMYMKLPKKQIIEMLINCNTIINSLTQEKKIEIIPTTNELTCDTCDCHPTIIYQTDRGRFCSRCKPSI